MNTNYSSLFFFFSSLYVNIRFCYNLLCNVFSILFDILINSLLYWPGHYVFNEFYYAEILKKLNKYAVIF